MSWGGGKKKEKNGSQTFSLEREGRGIEKKWQGSFTSFDHNFLHGNVSQCILRMRRGKGTEKGLL